MNWAEVVAHPSLRDLPFKIELNEYGQVVMNPVKINHSVYQGRIIKLISRLRQDGEVMAECAIWTRKGTKVADVAWASIDVFEQIEGKTEAQIAPEVCVEVVSMSNSAKEMREKRKLYFEQGAKEFWICDEYGSLSFYDESGELEQSKMFPEFPEKVSYK
ncbi:MAG: Uma2 family endonuclease [Pyrinomonadaceae bacterium]|nr:Uma2 family endonuclease [Pyrinomonadaceae bacterium]